MNLGSPVASACQTVIGDLAFWHPDTLLSQMSFEPMGVGACVLVNFVKRRQRVLALAHGDERAAASQGGFLTMPGRRSDFKSVLVGGERLGMLIQSLVRRPALLAFPQDGSRRAGIRLTVVDFFLSVALRRGKSSIRPFEVVRSLREAMDWKTSV